MNLTLQEAFDLGRAVGSFSIGEIDQGIHIILPGRDVDTGQDVNVTFVDLFDNEFARVNEPDTDELGMSFINAVCSWIERHDIDLAL